VPGVLTLVGGFALAPGSAGSPGARRLSSAPDPGPAWTAAALGRSARARRAQAGATVSVSPQPDTPDASPRTQISLLGAPPSSITGVSARGSRSGSHPGRLLAYAAAPGASFVPSRPFSPGETVHVRVRFGAGVSQGPLDFHFKVARPAGFPPPPRSPIAKPLRSNRIWSFVSRPELHPPRVVLTTDLASSAPGDIFLGALSKVGPGGHAIAQHGPLILDSRGDPVYFQPLAGREKAENFRVQSYEGAPVLTWWQGRINPLGFGRGDDLIMDSSYHLIARLHGGNGERPDLHEFLVTPQGTAWVTSYVPVHVNLSARGGSATGSMIDSIVQEIDIKTGLVMFEWHPYGHIPLSDSYQPVPKQKTYNPYHVNAVQAGPDLILMSARNTWAIYVVSVKTGRVVSTIGGKAGNFHLGPGARFAWEHDAQVRSDGTISMFDDEAAPTEKPPSRGLILRLDQSTRTATLAHQFGHPHPPVLAGSQGNLQSLPNGDVFIGWGSEPYFSEFTLGGQLVFDGHFPPGVQSYRAFRLAWAGHPTTKPDAAARPAAGGGVTVYASWNGATQVASWQVLAGPSAGSLGPVATEPRTGFETAITVKTTQPYVAVRGIDAQGHNLGTSPAVPS